MSPEPLAPPMPARREVRGGHCPVADAERPLVFQGRTVALSGYPVRVWECRVCGATIHEPADGAAPFGRHCQVNCPVECLGTGE